MMTGIFSPYRICPLGAHVDHQGGVVLGRTISIGTTIEYQPIDAREIHLSSDQLGETSFVIGAEIDKTHWARYAQAAARVFGERLKRGMSARIHGDMIGAGLSSSASVGLAYIQALADVNEINLTRSELVQLDFDLENRQLGLQNGILDPMTIVYGQKDAMLMIDTLTASATPIADTSDQAAWIVAYSGVSRELTKSGFNVRVAECHEAASLLQSGAWTLSDVPREVYENKKMILDENLRKRAEHFFTETDRVRSGAQAWQAGDFKRFGSLMNASCDSSINNYESGSAILIALHEIVSGTTGVYGSRFSGGGYGGCILALADKEKAEAVVIEIAGKISTLYPDLPSKVFIAETSNGFTVHRRPDPIRSAILLAAGRGKRQRPYTITTPKPLLEVNGRATLDYVLTAVRRAGIERICIITNHLEEQIFDYVGDGSKWNLSVVFAHQDELNGNGGALQAVPREWTHGESFIVTATDYALEENVLMELVQAHKTNRTPIVMSLKECPIEELSARSSVDVDHDGRVRRIIEKPKREEILSPNAASILFILPPQFWDYLAEIKPSERGEIELQSAVDRMIRDGYAAQGIIQPAPLEWDAALHLTSKTQTENSMKYFLGIDVGSSKTHALIADETGTSIGFGKAWGGNHQGVGYDGLEDVLKESFNQAARMANISPLQITGAGFGVAGYDFPSDRDQHLHTIAKLGLSCPVEIVNDGVNGLLAGATNGIGVNVTAGSSNNCRGRNKQGKEGRIVGNGATFGEYGGGFEIAAKALQMVNYAWIKRTPPTALTNILLEATGAKDELELVEGFSNDYFHLAPYLAIHVIDAAKKGDPSALDVIRWAGEELGWLAVAVARQIEMDKDEVEIIQSGSVFEAGPIITEPMRAIVLKHCPKAKLIRLDGPPVVGAVLLGMEQAHFDGYVIRDRTVATAKELVK